MKFSRDGRLTKSSLVQVTAWRWSLQWRHNDHDGVSNHKPYGCLLNLLFRPRSKKTSKLRVTGLCVGNSPGPVKSLHKGPVTRKMFPFDGVNMSGDKLLPAKWRPFSLDYKVSTLLQNYPCQWIVVNISRPRLMAAILQTTFRIGFSWRRVDIF